MTCPGSGRRLPLEWSGRAERGSAPHRAALVARCNDDGDEERGDSDDDGDGGRSGDEEDGGNNNNKDDDGGGGGESAGDARDGIRRVRPRRGETCLSLNCTRLHPEVQRVRCSRENAVVATHTRHGTDGALADR